MDLDVALRKFLFQFRIPGEAAIIDRILEKFAERYFAQVWIILNIFFVFFFSLINIFYFRIQKLFFKVLIQLMWCHFQLWCYLLICTGLYFYYYNFFEIEIDCFFCFFEKLKIYSKAQAQKMTREEWFENNRKYIPGLKENWDEEWKKKIFYM